MQRSLSEQKCPKCGAPLRFDPASGKSVCDWCGASYEISTEADAGLGEGGDYDAPVELELPLYNCLSCGAEIVADAVSASITSPYCGNNIVMTEKVTGGLRPDGIIPFKIDKKELPAAVRRFYADKKLLPRGFFSESSIENVGGVYVPFWLYDCTLSGRAHYEGRQSTSAREGDYIVTETRYYDVVRDVSMHFDQIPVDGSERLDDALMDSLEPFDMKDAVPFKLDYLSGFCAERFDRSSEQVMDRAEYRMRTSALSIADANARSGYESVTRLDDDLAPSEVDTKYMLLPVYTFSVKHGGKYYDFAMNGQTGKVVGDLPIDSGRTALWWLKHFAIAFGLLMLVIWLVSC